MKKTILPYAVIAVLAGMSIWGFTNKPDEGGGILTMEVDGDTRLGIGPYCVIVNEKGEFENMKLEKQKLSNGSSTYLVSITQQLNNIRDKGYRLVNSFGTENPSAGPSFNSTFIFEKELEKDFRK